MISFFPKCLVVDDSEDYLAVICDCLESKGITDITMLCNPVDVIKTLEAALEEDKPYDILISDNFMPILSGQDLLTLCRNHSSLSTLPIILLTGDPESFSVMDCLDDELKYKADDYLIKPFESEELFEKVILAHRNHQTNSK